MGVLLGLALERDGQQVERLGQGVGGEQHGDAHRGRVGVVGGLRHVHVVVRMQRRDVPTPQPHQLQPAVAQHLVDVHVGGCARATLEHVDRELLVQLAVDHLLCRLGDRRAFCPLKACRDRGWRVPRPVSPWPWRGSATDSGRSARRRSGSWPPRARSALRSRRRRARRPHRGCHARCGTWWAGSLGGLPLTTVLSRLPSPDETAMAGGCRSTLRL